MRGHKLVPSAMRGKQRLPRNHHQQQSSGMGWSVLKAWEAVKHSLAGVRQSSAGVERASQREERPRRAEIGPPSASPLDTGAAMRSRAGESEVAGPSQGHGIRGNAQPRGLWSPRRQWQRTPGPPCLAERRPRTPRPSCVACASARPRRTDENGGTCRLLRRYWPGS